MLHTLAFALVLVTTPAVQSAPADTPESVARDWSAELPVLFRELRAEPEDVFVRDWGAAYDSLHARLETAIAETASPPSAADSYRQRLLYEWARGRAAYPEQHARAVRDPAFQESATYWNFVDVLELNRPDLLDLPEYAAFMLGRLHARRDALIADTPDDFDPEAMRLTAELEEAARADMPEISCFFVRHAVEEHLDDHGADGWPDAADRALASCPGEETDALTARLAEARAARDGHRVDIYKTVGDVTLEAHVFESEAEGAPAMVWFHGGGWYQGSWSWCGVCEVFKEAGYTVVQIEYRLGARHGTGVAEAAADAADAVAWVRNNAGDLGVDPARIHAGGFSAGGHLALTIALLTPADAPGRPDAVAAYSACADLTETYWTVERAGDEEAAAALSPVRADLLNAPPVILVQARDDELCRHDPAQSLIDRLTAQGGEGQLISLRNGGHFAVYRDRDAYARAREDVLQFLAR